MELQTAIELIHFAPLPDTNGNWADLGCGTGLFTRALAFLLAPESIIYAVDHDRQALKEVQSAPPVTIKKIQADFIKDTLPLLQLDGILMANALHFVKEKETFIKKITGYCKPSHKLLVAEYDLDQANPWVPYPVSFTALQTLCKKAGYKSVEKIHHTPSTYNRADIYGAIITR
jgi:trans-aconitate methyltransferase